MTIVIPSGKPVGAEVQGIDASRDLPAADVYAVHSALDRHSVVVLRNQRLTPEQQIRFAGRFSRLDVHLLGQYLLPGYPELLVVSNVVENGKPIGLSDAGSEWHTDMSYMKAPTYLSMLYAMEVPVDPSDEPLGATRFVSTAHAYDTLPAELKARIEGRRAIHSYATRYRRRQEAGGKRYALTEEQRNRTPDVEHPIVRTHPRTGRRCLYVNAAYVISIPGMPNDEGSALIRAMCEHITRPDVVYTHRWQVGDLLMWDNVATQHLASFDYELPQRRRMYRTSSTGEVVT